MSVPLSAVMELVQRAVEPDRVARGRDRQAAVWLGEQPDYLPLLLGHTVETLPGQPHNRYWKLAEHELMGGVAVPECADYPHYSLAEQLDSPQKMLYEFLWELLSWARSGSDAQLTLRAYILHAIPEAFGTRYEFNEQFGMHAVAHPSKEAIRDFDPAALREGRVFRKLLEFTAWMVDHVPEGVGVYPADTGGPLVVAQAVRGNELFTDFYEDPEFVHELCSKGADTCIEAASLLKAVAQEERCSGYHGSLYMARGAVRVTGDPCVSISAPMHREFVLPHLRRVLAEFGGGWYHSCGYYPQHLEHLLETPEITALNFGNPEQWPQLEQTLGRMVAAGKVYYGALPVRDAADLEPALRRALSALRGRRRGLIVMLKGDGPWPDPRTTMDLWHRLQDELCPLG